MYIPSYISNPKIRFVNKDDKQNKRHYNVLVYIPDGKQKPYTVVWYDNHWCECYCKARTYRPYLGPIREEVHMTNAIELLQPDEPTEEDTASKDNTEQDTTIRHTPATIEVSSPESTH